MKVLLVRHGETVWNAEGRLQGQADIALSAHGRAQVMQLASWVQGYAPQRVIASDLLRTRETAGQLGFLHPVLSAAWREADLGDWTGRRISELRHHTPDDYRAWRAGTLTPPGAESFAALKARIDQALSTLLQSGDTTLVVTHGGAIRAVMANLFGLEPRALIPVHPASLSVISFNGTPRLEAYNLTPVPIAAEAPD
jgi:probable phosphoglycerate mutase